MTPECFEGVLTDAVSVLNNAVQLGTEDFRDSKRFEKQVLSALQKAVESTGAQAKDSFHPHAFPDISVNGFGVEVKHTNKDSWHAVGNSVFEGMRDETVKRVYVVFDKMGGWPAVKWARYEDCVTHVRISHAPRFVVDMIHEGPPLFEILGIPYEEFSGLSPEVKMGHVREYSRSRLKPGERLWWLEDREEQEHALPMEVRLYRHLSQDEKRELRAEAAILWPQICGPSRPGGKYDGAAIYLLTRHGVFCPQARDLFSAGSVALRRNEQRGGNYVLRALQDIEELMKSAAKDLEDELFVEYWGTSFPPQDRIREWLRRADYFARGWKPSQRLFIDVQ